MHLKIVGEGEGGGGRGGRTCTPERARQSTRSGYSFGYHVMTLRTCYLQQTGLQ